MNETVNKVKYVDVVFALPNKSGEYVAVENPNGQKISLGEWVERDDGYWVLRLPVVDGLLVSGEVGFLKRLLLEFEANRCDCGAEWKYTDAHDLVRVRLAELGHLKEL